jgi:SAM-dependent methyltransferase
MRAPNEVMAEIRGFMKSRVVLTAAELDFFTRLEKDPVPARRLAAELELDVRATTRVLDCLVTFSLLEKNGDGYRTTEEGSLLSSRHPQTILPMVRHMSRLWQSWGLLTEAVRKGACPEPRSPTERDEEDQMSFIGAMHVVGRVLAGEIAGACDLSSSRRLLDIGGASGSYTIAFLERNPQMTAVLFDLEGVVALAEERLREAGLAARVSLVAGDFYKDELPRECDLALLSAIIHQNSPRQNLDLYRKVYRALDPGGRLLIRDHIMDESRTRPPAGALFALNMLVNTPGGDTYTFSQVKEALDEAGFVEVRQVRNGERMDCLVEARKPL